MAYAEKMNDETQRVITEALNNVVTKLSIGTAGGMPTVQANFEQAMKNLQKNPEAVKIMNELKSKSQGGSVAEIARAVDLMTLQMSRQFDSTGLEFNRENFSKAFGKELETQLGFKKTWMEENFGKYIPKRLKSWLI